jgi:hypothetical protein
MHPYSFSLSFSEIPTQK